MQRAIAARLAGLLPELARPRVLELGCGTGLFSRHLVERYPDGSLVLTDAAPAMLSECRRNLAGARSLQLGFEVMDASRPGGAGPYDVIAMSMTLHWLADQAASLERLRRLLAPSGVLLYAALGPESFAEWRAVLADAGPSERDRRNSGAAGHRRRGAARARCERARLPSPHEIGRRAHAARRLPVSVGWRACAAPFAPPTRAAAASLGTSSMAASRTDDDFPSPLVGEGFAPRYCAVKAKPSIARRMAERVRVRQSWCVAASRLTPHPFRAKWRSPGSGEGSLPLRSGKSYFPSVSSPSISPA